MVEMDVSVFGENVSSREEGRTEVMEGKAGM
jgi:hypothetical protein